MSHSMLRSLLQWAGEGVGGKRRVFWTIIITAKVGEEQRRKERREAERGRRREGMNQVEKVWQWASVWRDLSSCIVWLTAFFVCLSYKLLSMTFCCGSTSKYFIHINMFGSTLNLGQDTTCIKHSVGGEGRSQTWKLQLVTCANMSCVCMCTIINNL